MTISRDIPDGRGKGEKKEGKRKNSASAIVTEWRRIAVTERESSLLIRRRLTKPEARTPSSVLKGFKRPFKEQKEQEGRGGGGVSNLLSRLTWEPFLVNVFRGKDGLSFWRMRTRTRSTHKHPSGGGKNPRLCPCRHFIREGSFSFFPLSPTDVQRKEK